jgi:hypothetical protein
MVIGILVSSEAVMSISLVVTTSVHPRGADNQRCSNDDPTRKCPTRGNQRIPANRFRFPCEIGTVFDAIIAVATSVKSREI